MTTQPDSRPPVHDPGKAALNKRLEDLTWAFFLIMAGVIWLMLPGRVPDGTLLIGAGLLLIALNLVRYVNRIAISGFTSLFGFLALAGGLAEFAGAGLPLFALCLIILGVSIVFKPLFHEKK